MVKRLNKNCTWMPFLFFHVYRYTSSPELILPNTSFTGAMLLLFHCITVSLYHCITVCCSEKNWSSYIYTQPKIAYRLPHNLRILEKLNSQGPWFDALSFLSTQKKKAFFPKMLGSRASHFYTTLLKKRSIQKNKVY